MGSLWLGPPGATARDRERSPLLPHRGSPLPNGDQEPPSVGINGGGAVSPPASQCPKSTLAGPLWAPWHRPILGAPHRWGCQNRWGQWPQPGAAASAWGSLLTPRCPHAPEPAPCESDVVSLQPAAGPQAACGQEVWAPRGPTSCLGAGEIRTGRPIFTEQGANPKLRTSDSPNTLDSHGAVLGWAAHSPHWAPCRPGQGRAVGAGLHCCNEAL